MKKDEVNKGFGILSTICASTTIVGFAILLSAALTVPASAQWLDRPWRDIPRTIDGDPDLTALTPRRADGKPDFSGVWDGIRPVVTLGYRFMVGDDGVATALEVTHVSGDYIFFGYRKFPPVAAAGAVPDSPAIKPGVIVGVTAYNNRPGLV